ncbi:ATP-binding cassette domain-containing protein [Pseudobacteriovorax antillogorgiicola]|uniref:ATP-binding cassette domain-containing protein n=1 Tax=Pseudobacteriovorax antillogorgiicola TaxID=1513793 RepID=UPI001F46FF67|nr:ATP-binding cassette domain-containing protein [Pseudobacteriovorax antillogorgiicola]
MEKLSKQFQDGGAYAVRDVSFHVDKGQIACLIGSSGCGKTTTLRMINRLLEPSSGSISINGVEYQSSDPIAWRRGMGYVVQSVGLMPHMTIRQNIEILSRAMGRERSERRKRSRKLMDMVGLPPDGFSDRYPDELSGGQQQRVGIARALMEDPPVLLMDEPFGALDPIIRSSMHEELIQLNRQLQKTILMVTHDMSEAFKLGNLIAIMDQGSIVQQGTPRQLIDQPVNEFVANFCRGAALDLP